MKVGFTVFSWPFAQNSQITNCKCDSPQSYRFNSGVQKDLRYHDTAQ